MLRRTYDSLAAELGISYEHVRQLKADSLIKLAHASADDRYALLRVARGFGIRPGRDAAASGEGCPAWMERLLSWLSERIR